MRREFLVSLIDDENNATLLRAKDKQALVDLLLHYDDVKYTLANIAIVVPIVDDWSNVLKTTDELEKFSADAIEDGE